MISAILNAFERGIKVMQLQTRLLLVAVLLFVFPLLFLLTSQNVFDTAAVNINTSEKQRVGLLQDSLVEIISLPSVTNEDLQKVITALQVNNADIIELNIVTESSDGYLIQNALDETLVGTIDSSKIVYQSALNNPTESLIFEYETYGERQWQVVRKVTLDNQNVYITSTHTFRAVDSVMKARRQESYLGLSLIFIFLMSLAYWLARQIHWQKKYEILADTLEERNLFTNMIAHEFRTPLTAIKGYASFLAESKSISSDETKYVANIQVSAERLIHLVSDFLEVARIQSGKLGLEKTDVDVQAIITEAITALAPIAKEKSITLDLETLKIPVFLRTDQKRLTQVLTNLLSNSIKYTDSGMVTVAVEKTPLSLFIRIKDTGMGISADDQKKLFAPFSRVGGVEKTTTTGTGLGMWITKQLVELLGGTIAIESIKGVGTHVVLQFKNSKIAS